MNASIKAKHVLNRALFPVSAGAVGAQLVTVVGGVLRSGIAAELVGWAGFAAAIAALIFQITTRKRQ